MAQLNSVESRDLEAMTSQQIDVPSSSLQADTAVGQETPEVQDTLEVYNTTEVQEIPEVQDITEVQETTEFRQVSHTTEEIVADPQDLKAAVMAELKQGRHCLRHAPVTPPSNSTSFHAIEMIY